MKIITPPQKTKNHLLLITTALILTTPTNFGNMYINDIPQQMSKGFLNYFNITQQDIQFLYSLYSLGATPMALLGGFLVTYFTSNLTSLFSNFGSFISTILTYIGIYYKKYYLVMISRVLFGISAETFIVAQLSQISEIFTGKYLSLATGLNQAFNSLGFAVSFFVNPKMYLESRGIFLPFFLGGIACFICTLFCLIWTFIDHFKEKNVEEVENITKFEFKQILELRDIRIGLTIFNLVVTGQCLFIFNTFATGCLMTRFGYTLSEAKNIISIMPLITIPSIPIYSAITSKIGKKMILGIFGYLMVTTAFIILLLLPYEKSNLVYLSYILLSQFWSLSSSINFSSITLVSPKKLFGVAFGFTFFLNSLVFSGMSLYYGWLLKEETRESYSNALISVIVVGILGIILCSSIYIIDKKRGGVLNYPEGSEESKTLRMKINNEDYLVMNEEK